MMDLAVYIAVSWIACGLLAAGFNFAYFQDEFPRLADSDFADDLQGALISGLLLGPIALIADVWHTKCKHGWRLWRKPSNIEVQGRPR